MRLLASTVGRNEAGRWLGDMLMRCSGEFDGHFFYDDRSDDNTLEIARGWSCTTVERDEDQPAFLEHEGMFRQAAWEAFERTMKPEPGDWILSIDCDELLVRSQSIRAQCEAARGQSSLIVKIPECFGFDADGWPLVRTDGYWGTIAGTRLFSYRRGGRFADKAMASGSEPTYATGGHRRRLEGAWLLHVGYAREEDRREKHARYSVLSGHADSHVESILQRPTLARWDGPWA